MRTFFQVLRVIYLPFLLIDAGFVVGCSFLYWLLVIKAELFSSADDGGNFILTCVLAVVVLLVWLRPRLKALRYANDRAEGFVYAVAVCALAVPALVAQHYLRTATGGRTVLARLNMIDAVARTKYYTVPHVSLDKADALCETDLRWNGRSSSDLRLQVDFFCPMVDTTEAEQDGTATVWLVRSAEAQLGPRSTQAQIDDRLRALAKSAWVDFAKQDPGTFSYFERIAPGPETERITEAIRRSGKPRGSGPITVLKAHREAFEERDGQTLAWVFGSFGIGAVFWLAVLSAAAVDRAELDRLLNGNVTKDESLREALALFLPSRHYCSTPLLIDVMIVVFLVMVFEGFGTVAFRAEDLLMLGANFRPAIVDGEVWRLVVSLFLHGGVFHLVANVLGLLLVGCLLEPQLGPVRFAVCFFGAGVGGGLASLLWYEATVSVGASGGIMGLWSILIVFASADRTKVPLSENPIIRAGLFVVAYTVVMGLLAQRVDNAAHLGGLACGLLAGAMDRVSPGLLRPGRACPRAGAGR